jgi:xylulokinase
MLCYKNGGLAREHVRDQMNQSKFPLAVLNSWKSFNETALSTAPLAQKSPSDPMRLCLYFPRPEIVPNLPAGQWRYTYDPNTESLTSEPSSSSAFDARDARNIVESQMLSLRLRSQALVQGEKKTGSTTALPPQPGRVYLVGGGSANPAIAQICGEVLGGVDGVYRLDIGGNACALGAAYKAVWGCERRSKGETFEDLIGARWDAERFVKKVAEGYQEGVFERYGVAVKGFDKMEKEVLAQENSRGGEKE